MFYNVMILIHKNLFISTGNRQVIDIQMENMIKYVMFLPDIQVML